MARPKATPTDKKKNNQSAQLGFETEIWRAAVKLRGNIDASEYKQVILGLIFLKYISDRFETRRAEIENEFTCHEDYDDFLDDPDEYIAEGVFYVPPSARWAVIEEAAPTGEIGSTIDAAMQELEKSNRRLKGILPKNFARPELDQRRLGDVVLLFSNIEMHSKDKDILGRVYEYCLQKFAEAEGKNAGEFYTPSCVVRTLVEILEPYRGRVYDPCCGSGGMFVQSAKFIQEHRYQLDNISVFGQDANPTTRKLALMNLAIHGIYANLGAHHADTFYHDAHPNLKADFILANPPFNLSDWGSSRLADDVRWKYGLPPEGNANYAWIQHIIHHLAPTGRAGVILANGSLSSQSGGEGEIRKRLVQADLVECIVAMPPQLFYSTQIPVCIWFFNRNKTVEMKGKTLFIDAREMGEMETRKLRVLTKEDIEKIAAPMKNLHADTPQPFEAERGFSALVTVEDIAKQDFILTPGRYVGIAEQEEDSEPFDEKMKRLTAELAGLFEESYRLEEEIKKQLGGIGFEI